MVRQALLHYIMDRFLKVFSNMEHVFQLNATISGKRWVLSLSIIKAVGLTEH